jgi:hypothetical protein
MMANGDPSPPGSELMNREQREAELREMLTTQRGKEELLATLKKHAGMEDEGNLPPFGTLLVDAILNYEYPPEANPEHSEPASEKKEPGDVKFDEPPGREAPGG